MPAQRTRQIQNDYSDGMNRDVAPTQISATGAYDLVDVLLDEDANPYKRGGTAYKSSAGLGTSGLIWGWDGYLYPGQRTVIASGSDFGVLGSDDASIVNLGGAGLSLPKQSAVLEDLLFIGGGSIYGGSRKTAAYTTGTVTVTKDSKTVTGSGTTWNTLVDSGMLFHTGSGRVYVVASVDSTTQITLRDAYEGTTGSGKSYELTPVYAVGSDPYETWDFLAVCANRLVTAFGNVIKFSEINNPHSYTNTLGTANEHTLPEGIQILGLASVGQTLLAFTTAGIWTIDGLALDIVDANGNTQHRIQQLSAATILAGAPGLAAFEQSLVIPALDGVYLMDGISRPIRISRPIERLYRQWVEEGYRFGRAVVFRGHYFLPVISGSGSVRDLLVCRLDRPTSSQQGTVFPWTRFSGDGGEITSYFVRSTTGSEAQLYGAQAREPSRIVNCSAYFEPDGDHKTDADGSVHSLDLITRDIPTGEGTVNAIRGLLLRYELVDAGEDEPTLKVSWSDGAVDTGSARWGEVNWDEFEWAEEGGAVFNPVELEGPPSDGRLRHKFRINKRLPYGRFRVRSSGPSASCVLRGLEMTIRPSGAVRK
jgi:hypothetical protein